MRLCLGLALAILLTGGVPALNGETYAAESNIPNAKLNEEVQARLNEDNKIDVNEYEENIVTLSEIIHYTKLNNVIDISLSRETFDEICYVQPPNGQLTETTFIGLSDVAVHGRSIFVACRIAVYIASDDMIGEWKLCGLSESGERRMRCQPVRIEWYEPGTPSKSWTLDERMEVDRPIQSGGVVYPGVEDSKPVLTCHVITPNGEDLVIKSDMNYPFITRTNAHKPNLCSVSITINPYTLGDWVIYGRFYSDSTQHEVRLPMSFYTLSSSYDPVYDLTILAESDHIVTLGGTYVDEVRGSGQIDECVYITPSRDIYNLDSGFANEGVYLESLDYAVACRLNIGPITTTMLGQWYFKVKSNDGSQYYETIRLFKLTEGTNYDSESEENTSTSPTTESDSDDDEIGHMTVLSVIKHFTQKQANIDVSLNKETFEEDCYIRPPGSDMYHTDILEMEGVKVQSKSNFVSCRVTIGPMTEHLLGRWTLCGKSKLTQDTRCQPIEIVWEHNNGNVEWHIDTEPIAPHPVHFGGSVNSGTSGAGDVNTCHVITPAGEDLVVSAAVVYPHIESIETNLPLCDIIFKDITEDMLGDWQIIGRFRSALGQYETRQPLNFFLYNEDNPHEQAYNVTHLSDKRHIVHLGGELSIYVSRASGATQDCIFKTPAGELYDTSNYQEYKGEGVYLKYTSPGVTPAECVISFMPITEDAIGKWHITGKFSNGVLFDEIQQNVEIVKEDANNPIEDETDREIEILPEKRIDAEMNTSHNIVIKSAAFVENESCHLVTPTGLQYALIDGFNVTGIEVIKENGVECGVKLDVVSFDMIGTWTLIARATKLYVPIERRQPFTIHVEENFVLQNDIYIAEGADLYLHLNYAIIAPETCAIYGPDGEKYVDAVEDPMYPNSCGYIIKSVDQQHTGKWILEFGSSVKSRGSVNVHVTALVDIAIDDLRWSIGDSINISLGPEDTVYCKIEDPNGHIMYDDFGQCKIVLNRVAQEHNGLWRMYIGVPGNVLLQTVGFVVSVLERDGSPIVTTAVERNAASVMMSCTVPNEYEVNSCTFRSPEGTTLIAAHGVGQDGYMFNGSFVSNYESDTHSHDCTIRLMNPTVADLGIWRCAMLTTTGTYYGFITVVCPHLMQDPEVAVSIVTEPVLQATQEISYEEFEPTVMSCSIPAALRYCYFRASNGTIYNVFPTMSSSQSFEYVGASLDAGECGIRFKNGLASSEGGMWSCHVGLVNTSLEEQRTSFSVNIRAKISVYHAWHTHALTVGAIVYCPYSVEYCRFVRIDGRGFTSEHLPSGYEIDHTTNDEHCIMYITHPTVLDLHPWTVAVKFRGVAGEVSMTTTENLFTGLAQTNIFGEILFWTLIVFICLVPALAASALIPKNNREWTYRRASGIRTSFRSTWDRTFKKMPLQEEVNKVGQV